MKPVCAADCLELFYACGTEPVCVSGMKPAARAAAARTTGHYP